MAFPCPPSSRPAPPRPRTPTWVVAVITGGVVFAALCLAAVALFAFSRTRHDRIELIDTPEVAQAAEGACATMRARVVAEAVPSGVAAEVKVRSIRGQNAAVTDLVARVRGLGEKRLREDVPTATWLSDWEALVEAREQYARELSTGARPHFLLPTADGHPLTERMNSVGLTFQVPPELVDLP
ncbi:hypothetical protein NCC78_18795 [Micromonospora phytophila]|uniref:hypothetical protein n=1 Tax=Micromonospora phytophila TaxID=709888 RepID=UPI00202EC245|nr:hypothetical protein [Micromonospora phytophila]MCM0676715.1 hypothetical protein [Micromonospora phytophila]